MERDKLISLVTKAQQGDQDALNDLFNAFYNDVYYFALKTVKDDQIACDITQEAFVEIINTLGNLQEPAAFVKWMKQITYHQCTRYFKKKKDVIVDEDEDGNTIFDTLQEDKAEFIPEEALDKDDFKKTIMSMIDDLSEEQRAALMMFYYDELSIKQIAEIQGTNENTVKSRLNYAKKGIKKSVEDYEKKNGVKLHCVGVLPLLLWLFKDYFAQSVPASASVVAEGVAGATGTAVAITATTTTTATVTTATTTAAVGVGAKIASLPIATKIIAGIVAATIAIGGTVAVVSNRDNNTSDDTSSIVSSEETTTTDDDTMDEDKYEETVPEHTPYIVPAGGKYTTVDGKVYGAGESVTAPPQIGDTFETADYTYRYNFEMTRNWETDDIGWSQIILDGWGVVVKDKSKDTYPQFEQSINGYSVKSLAYTFMGCANMTVAPQTPEGVTEYYFAFAQCTSLKTAPNIPDGAINLNSAFIECVSLTETPFLPDSVENIGNAFTYCTSLTTVTNFPANLKYMAAAFDRCESLVNVPDLPNTVEEMPWAFQGCSSLVKAPVIPASVKVMYSAFMSCSSLTGTVEINAILREDNMPCNNSCALCASGQYGTCENCGECCSYADCFAGETRQPITLIGTCSKLEAIAKTNLWGNVVVG